MNVFKNLKIGKKLMLSFFTILVLTISLIIYLLVELKETDKLSDELFRGPYKLTEESLNVRMEVIGISRNLNSGFVDNNHDGERQEILQYFDNINDRIERMRKLNLKDLTIEYELDNLKNIISKYKMLMIIYMHKQIIKVSTIQLLKLNHQLYQNILKLILMY